MEVQRGVDGLSGPGTGLVGINYRAAFGCPNSIVNDAAMQQ
jgi:hypothetical protein